MKLSSLLFILFTLSQLALSQDIEEGYFMFPIRPAQENYLAGSMGELRSTHFHTGIDIKTSGISGLSVYAAADGYLQRVKVSASGYGNAMYVAHPNGTTTVYAHLKSFSKEVAEYVRNEQYKKESFAVDINVPKDRFTFKKGDVIALSGNSGSSSGPHLHFEIRDKNQEVLNPLKYGFKEIKDNIGPTLASVAFVTMDAKSRINGMFGRHEFDVVEKNGNYSLVTPVTLLGNIGVEVYAYDKFDGAKNRNGVVVQKLLLDQKEVFAQNIDKLSFSLSRNMMVHVNYKRLMEGGRRFNKYYVDDGNFLKFYETNENNGIINIYDPLEHVLDIYLEDNYGNNNQYRFKLNAGEHQVNLDNKNMVGIKKRGYDVRNGIIEMVSESEDLECFARVYVKGEEKLLPHAYRADGRTFFIWDTRSAHPDSVVMCDKSIQLNYKKSIPPRGIQNYSDEDLDITFPSYSLFDTLNLRFEKSIDTSSTQEIFAFDHYDHPLRKFASIKIKPSLSYDEEHAFVYSVFGKNNLNFVGGKWENGEITFKTRDLVKYTIASDTVPPVISELKSKAGILRFRIKDKKSGIKSFRGELDGKWVLLNYDAKSATLTSDPKVSLQGTFDLKIEDNSGNETSWQKDF